jgi:hypothetical protein
MTQNRLWMIGGAIVIVAILAIGYFLVITPKIGEGDQTALQVQQAAQQQESTQSDLAKLQGQYKNLAALTAKLNSLEIAVPGSPDASDFTEELAAFQTASGAKISEITFGEGEAATPALAPVPASTASPTPTPTPAATTAPTTTTTTTTNAPTPGAVYAVAVSIKLTGKPDTIVAFSKLAQAGPRYFLATGLIFDSPSIDDASSSGSSSSSSSSGSGSSGSSGSSDPNGFTGSINGYVYVVLPAVGVPTPTPTPIPTPVTSSIPTMTPTPTFSPKP